MQYFISHYFDENMKLIAQALLYTEDIDQALELAKNHPLAAKVGVFPLDDEHTPTTGGIVMYEPLNCEVCTVDEKEEDTGTNDDFIGILN